MMVSNDKGSPNKLYINNQNDTFTDASEQFGIRTIDKTSGIVSADLDNDDIPETILASGNEVSKILYSGSSEANMFN